LAANNINTLIIYSFYKPQRSITRVWKYQRRWELDWSFYKRF